MIAKASGAVIVAEFLKRETESTSFTRGVDILQKVTKKRYFSLPKLYL